MTYPSGKVIAYTYDAQGRVSGMTVNGVSLVSAITYQPFGLAKSWMWNGGPLQTRAFDLNGRQTSYPYTATGTVNTAYDLAEIVARMQYGEITSRDCGDAQASGGPTISAQDPLIARA